MKKIAKILKGNEGIDKKINDLEKKKEKLEYKTKVNYPSDGNFLNCEIHIDGRLHRNGEDYVFDIHVTEAEDKESDTIEGLTILELEKLRDLLNKIL